MISDSPEPESKLILVSCFNERLSSKLLPGDNERSTAVDDLCRPLVVNWSQSAYFRDFGMDKKYEPVTSFLYAFVIRYSNLTNFFLSKRTLLFPWEVIWVYGIASAVNENGLVMDLSHAHDKVLQLKDGPPALPLFTKHRSNILQKRYKIIEKFEDRWKQRQVCGVLSSTRLIRYVECKVLRLIYVFYVSWGKCPESRAGSTFLELYCFLKMFSMPPWNWSKSWIWICGLWVTRQWINCWGLTWITV